MNTSRCVAARTAAWLGSCALLLTLTACGGGDDKTKDPVTPSSTDDPAQTFHSSDYWAGKVGTRFVYTKADDPTLDQFTFFSEVKEAISVAGWSGVLIETSAADGSLSDRAYVTSDQDGLRYINDPNGPATATWIWTQLPEAFQIGDSFVQKDVTTSYENIADDGIHYLRTVRETTMSTIVGTETVTTPAGVFKNCIKVQRTYTVTSSQPSTSGSPASSTTTSSTSFLWFAPGIGQVKTAMTLSDGSIETYELRAYLIDGQGSENIRPTATLPDPPAAANHWHFGETTIQFSEPMLYSTLNHDAVVVTGPSGQIVPASIKLTTTSMTVTPTALPSSGQYQISVNDQAKDWAGNSAIPASWAFQVDATPPMLVQTEFLAGQIILTFDEEIVMPLGFSGIAFVNASGPMALVGQNQIRFDSKRIVIATDHLDVGEWQYGATYSVIINSGSDGLFDLAGNHTSNAIATITLPSGPF